MGQPTTSTTNGASPRPSLLSLPPELRLHIYAYLLPPAIISITPSSSPPGFTARPTVLLHPAVLRTCRLIHAEVAPALYRAATFAFGTHVSLVSAFLSAVDSAQGWLERVRVYKVVECAGDGTGWAQSGVDMDVWQVDRGLFALDPGGNVWAAWLWAKEMVERVRAEREAWAGMCKVLGEEGVRVGVLEVEVRDVEGREGKGGREGKWSWGEMGWVGELREVVRMGRVGRVVVDVYGEGEEVARGLEGWLMGKGEGG